MPYIAPAIRTELAETGRRPYTAGTLTYALTRLVDRYLWDRGVEFATLAEAISALECAKLELYRRIAAPYEDQKRHDNGDVYSVGPR